MAQESVVVLKNSILHNINYSFKTNNLINVKMHWLTI